MQVSQLVAELLKNAALPPGSALITLVVALSFVGVGAYLIRLSLVHHPGDQDRKLISDRAALFGGLAHFFIGYFMVGWALAEGAPDARSAVEIIRYFPGHVIAFLFWWLFVMEVTTPIRPADDDSRARRALLWIFNLPRSPYSTGLLMLSIALLTYGQIMPYSALAQAFQHYPESGPIAPISELLVPGDYYWVEVVTLTALLSASFAHVLPLWWEQRSQRARSMVDRTAGTLALGALCLLLGPVYIALNISFELGLPDGVAVLLVMAGIILTAHALHVNHGLRIGGVYRRHFIWPVILGPTAAIAVLLLLLSMNEGRTSYIAFGVLALAATLLSVWTFSSDQLKTLVMGETPSPGPIIETPAGEPAGAGDLSVPSVSPLPAEAQDVRPGRDILSQSPRVIGLDLIRPALKHYRSYGRVVTDSNILLDLELIAQQQQADEERPDTLRRLLAGLVEMEKPLPFPKQATELTAALELSMESGPIQRYVSLKYWWLMHVPHNSSQRNEARQDMYVDYYRAVESGDELTLGIVDRLIEINISGARGRAVLQKWRDAGCVEIARRLQRREAEARNAQENA